MGRKRKQNALKVVSFRIEPEIYSKLKRINKYSQMIRNVLKEVLENYE
jgi:hypothetical protein